MRRISNIKRRYGVLLGLVLAAGLVSLDARAQNIVYHSPNDDGVNPGFAFELPIGPGESLFLWLDVGSTVSQNGTACNDGDGREICGYEVVVDALGSAVFSDFFPQLGGLGVVHQITPSQLKVNGLFALNPTAGAVRIGELKVEVIDLTSAVMVMGGKVVLAALQVESVSQSNLATVPEPGGWLPLLAGAVWLLGLRRRRAPSILTHSSQDAPDGMGSSSGTRRN